MVTPVGRIASRAQGVGTSSVRAKKAAKTTPDGDPVHSLRTLFDDLATITRNTVAPRLPGTEPFQVTTRPTTLQTKVFELLGAEP